MSKARMTKYAIYKTLYGALRAVEYIDTLEGCKDLLGANHITKDDLPILVNNAGGRCWFNPNDKNFVEIIKIHEDDQPLTREQRYPKNSPNFEFGWIDKEGNTYTCGYEGHGRAADAIADELGMNSYSGERTLEEAGWLKVTKDSRTDGKAVYVDGLFVTKKQADALFDLGLYDAKFVKHMIEYSQKLW